MIFPQGMAPTIMLYACADGPLGDAVHDVVDTENLQNNAGSGLDDDFKD